MPMTKPVAGKPLRDQAILQWAAQLVQAVLLDDIAAAAAAQEMARAGGARR